MMSKKIIYLVLTVTLLFFVACTDDHETGGGDPPQSGDITFVLPGVFRGASSYADPPVASDEEKFLDELTIFMFNDASGILEKIFETNLITYAKVDDVTHSATINLTRISGKKTFYFLINGDEASIDFKSLVVGVTPESEFIEIVSDKNTEIITTPLLMSGKTTVTTVESPDPDELKVPIRRRVARFDVENDSVITNFKIEKIYISKANLRTYIFSNATGTPPKTIETDNYKPIDFTVLDNENEGETNSVFYLYPTEFETGKTEISFVGLSGGERKTYNLHLENPVAIEANARYVLKAKQIDINNVEFSLNIEKWTDGSEHSTDPSSELVEFSAVEKIGGDGIPAPVDNSYNIGGLTTPGILTFTTKSNSKEGTKLKVTYNHGNEQSWPGLTVNDPDPVLTYGMQYSQKYEIFIPVPTTKYPVEVEIEVYNALNIDQRKIITLYADRYPGTNFYPVQFGNIYWAPVNVGSVVKDGYITLDEKGKFYQWGRNEYASVYGATNDTYPGPVAIKDASTTHADKFITHLFTPGNWASDISTTVWDAQGPCPTGWRLPTQAELQLIKAEYDADNGNVKWENTDIKIIGTNNNGIIYLPATGYRGSNGRWYDQGTSGAYWSKSINNPYSVALTFDDKSMTIVNTGEKAYRGNGYMVRCVR